METLKAKKNAPNPTNAIEGFYKWVGESIISKDLGSWAVSPAQRRVSKRGEKSEHIDVLAVKWDSLEKYAIDTPFDGKLKGFQAQMDAEMEANIIGDGDMRHRFWTSKVAWDELMHNRENNIPLLPNMPRPMKHCQMYPITLFGLEKSDLAHFSRSLRSDYPVEEKVFEVKKPRILTNTYTGTILTPINISEEQETALIRKFPTVIPVSSIRLMLTHLSENPDFIKGDFDISDEKFKKRGLKRVRLNVSVSEKEENLLCAMCNKYECTTQTFFQALITGMFDRYLPEMSMVC